MPDDPNTQRRRHLRLVLDEHERERSELADELHEQVAQALAVVLFGLDALARDPACEGSTSRIAALRGHVAETLEYCRGLAVALRPPLLDQLGLVPALERLAQRAGVAVSVDRGLAAAPLGPALETEVYRTVEAALSRASGHASLAVALDTDLHEVCVSVRPLEGDVGITELDQLEARLELIGGTLTAGPTGLEVRIPIEPGAEAA